MTFLPHLSLRKIAVLALLAGLLPMPAFAKDVDMGNETFDHTKKVSDKELSTMRGGFNGNMFGNMIDFSFLSRVQTGLSVVQDLNIDTNSLAQAALTASQINDFIQPQIIQNIDDGTLISIHQALNIDVVSTAVLNAIAQVQQSSYQQTLGNY